MSSSCWWELLEVSSACQFSHSPVPWPVMSSLLSVRQKIKAHCSIHTCAQSLFPSLHTTGHASAGIKMAQAAAANLLPAQNWNSNLWLRAFHLSTMRRSCLLRRNCSEPWLTPQLFWLLFSSYGHSASALINPEGQAGHCALQIFLRVTLVSPLTAFLPWTTLPATCSYFWRPSWQLCCHRCDVLSQ